MPEEPGQGVAKTSGGPVRAGAGGKGPGSGQGLNTSTLLSNETVLMTFSCVQMQSIHTCGLQTVANTEEGLCVVAG